MSESAKEGTPGESLGKRGGAFQTAQGLPVIPFPWIAGSTAF